MQMSTVWYGTGLHKLLHAGKRLASPQSSVPGPQSLFYGPYSSVLIPQSSIHGPQSSVCNNYMVCKCGNQKSESTAFLLQKLFCSQKLYLPHFHLECRKHFDNICRRGQAASCAAMVWNCMVWYGMVCYIGMV